MSADETTKIVHFVIAISPDSSLKTDGKQPAPAPPAEAPAPDHGLKRKGEFSYADQAKRHLSEQGAGAQPRLRADRPRLPRPAVGGPKLSPRDV